MRRRCMKGRRIVMIGDSLTWQMYNSLACLLAPVTAKGFSTLWENANTTVTSLSPTAAHPTRRNR